MNSCEKTYEDGPAISFRSKLNRITGKWKLKSMEGVTRINPEIDQYMELTKENIEGDKNKYIAYFVNFQERDCNNDTSILVTADGWWEFTDEGAWWGPGELELNKKEGIRIMINDTSEYAYLRLFKIFELSNNKLHIKSYIDWMQCLIPEIENLTFEKE
jgi:hypothetical protein